MFPQRAVSRAENFRRPATLSQGKPEGRAAADSHMTDETGRRKTPHGGEREAAEREAMEREAKAHDEALQRAEDRLVDLGSEQSFPASDPPSYMGGAAVAGAPPAPAVHREDVSHELSDPNAAEPAPPLAPELKHERKKEKGHGKKN